MEKYRLTEEQLKIAEQNGIRRDLAIRRYRDDVWDEEKAITQKPKKKLIDWVKIAEKNGIGKFTFYNRVNTLKWPEKKAATKKVQVHKKGVAKE